MNTSFEPNDELSRLWQAPDRPLSDKEAQRIMELVEARTKTFDQTVFWRNVREYVAAAAVSLLYAWFAYNAETSLGRLGYTIVSATGPWVILVMWLIQRSGREPMPESSGEVYKNELLRKYDRQILLTRTAWAWYVLPFAVGSVISVFGFNSDHLPATIRYVVAGFMVAIMAGIAIVNWMAANALVAEKRELLKLLESAE